MRADIILLQECKTPRHWATKPPDSEAHGNYVRLHAPNQTNHLSGGVAILVDKAMMARARHKQLMIHHEGRYLGVCIQGCEGTKYILYHIMASQGPITSLRQHVR